MAGTVTIQWCPSCKAWGSNVRTANETVAGESRSFGDLAINYDYRRAAHQCEACGGQFVTAQPLRRESHDLWQVHSELTSISRSMSSLLSFAARAPDTDCWNHHPELADFSASVV